MGEVVAFPRARDRRFVRKHAANVASMDPRLGERYLAQQLLVQRQTMVRRGIDSDAIETEIRALELVIRAKVWQLVLTGGAA
jgi:hypothetical protein